jgi:hypothetical protein
MVATLDPSQPGIWNQAMRPEPQGGFTHRELPRPGLRQLNGRTGKERSSVLPTQASLTVSSTGLGTDP